jgi:hypothetical protein
LPVGELRRRLLGSLFFMSRSSICLASLHAVYASRRLVGDHADAVLQR